MMTISMVCGSLLAIRDKPVQEYVALGKGQQRLFQREARVVGCESE